MSILLRPAVMVNVQPEVGSIAITKGLIKAGHLRVEVSVSTQALQAHRTQRSSNVSPGMTPDGASRHGVLRLSRSSGTALVSSTISPSRTSLLVAIVCKLQAKPNHQRSTTIKP